MSCPKVIRVVTPGPPGPPGGSITLTGPSVLGRAEATAGGPVPLPLGPGLVVIGGTLQVPEVTAQTPGMVPAGWISGATAATLPHIHGALAGPVYEHVRNVSGAVMPALTPYHVVGSQGDTDIAEIVPADASDPQTMPASGITLTELAASGAAATGHGAIAGVPTGVNTAGNPSGTVLYVGSGVLTPTPPAANVQALAIVGRSHATTGTLAMLPGPALARVAYTGSFADMPKMAAVANATDATSAVVRLNELLQRLRNRGDLLAS